MLNICKENVLNFPAVKQSGIVDLCMTNNRFLASFPGTLNQLASYAEDPIPVLLNVLQIIVKLCFLHLNTFSLTY